MKVLSHFIFFLLTASSLFGCAYFDTQEAPPLNSSHVETIDLMAGEAPVLQQDVRDVILNATGGRVQVFSLDGTPPEALTAENEDTEPLVSTVESALNENDMVELMDVAPLETALPGGAMLPYAGAAPYIRSGDPSVDIFSLDDE